MAKKASDKVSAVIETAIFAVRNREIIRTLKSTIKAVDSSKKKLTVNAVLDALSESRMEKFNSLVEDL